MRWILVVALLALPTAQAAWQDEVWWGTGLGDDLRLERNQTAGAAAVYTAADYVTSADPPDGPQGVSWTFTLERANETLALVWGAPLNITTAFSPHTAQIDVQEPQEVREQVPGVSAAVLRATLVVDGREVVRTAGVDVDGDGWQEVTWQAVNPLHTIPADAVVELVITAEGPASHYRLGLSNATGWTRVSLPVFVPPPPVIYNVTTDSSSSWQVAWSEDILDANRSHVATWSSPGVAVLQVETKASNGTAWVAVRDSLGKEIFNGTSAFNKIVHGEPGNWTIEARATGFSGSLAWTIRDIDGAPIEEGPVQQAPADAPVENVAPSGGTPVNEWKPAQPIDDREAPVPWWLLLVAVSVARARR